MNWQPWLDYAHECVFATAIRRERSWAGRFELPPEQFEKEENADITRLSKSNSLIGNFVPALPRLRWADASAETRRAMIKAAVAVKMDGPSGLKKFPDPYDEKAFEYTAEGEGFRLESRLREDGNPVSLILH